MKRRAGWLFATVLGALPFTGGCATHAPVRSAEDLADFHRRTENATLELIRHDGSKEKVHEVHVADGFLQAYRHDATGEVRVPISQIRVVRQRARDAGFILYTLAGGGAGFLGGALIGAAAIDDRDGLSALGIVAAALAGTAVGGVAGATVGLVRGVHVNHDLTDYDPTMDAVPSE